MRPSSPWTGDAVLKTNADRTQRRPHAWVAHAGTDMQGTRRSIRLSNPVRTRPGPIS